MARLDAPLEFIRVHHGPDHTFPHGIPNPLLPENHAATGDVVKREQADFGVAFDGDDLPPEAPSFITRVCGFGFHILLRQFEQARRVRSPQISQALGALQRVFGCAEMSAV